MATGRTLQRWARVYVAGYDVSGFARSIGPLSTVFTEADLTALEDGVRGVLPDTPQITPGTLNAVYDNTATSGLQAALGTAGQARAVMVAVGIRAAPAQGDPAFAGYFEQLGYNPVEDGGALVVNIPFGNWDVSGLIGVPKAWGWLLHAKGAETAVNTAVGIDDNGASSTKGGVLNYQLFTSNGTVTLKAQHASTNVDGSFADITGATSGSIDASSTPAAGAVATSPTLTINRYLRWQLVFGTATTATFAMAFVRG